MMQPYQPFTGVLLMPDRKVFGTTSPVMFPNGQPVAQIRWHNWSMRARFEILDPSGAVELANGGRSGGFGRTYRVTAPRGETLLEFKVGWWGKGTVILPGGQLLTTKGSWTSRKVSVYDQVERPVARIVTTSRAFAVRQDSYAFEVGAPVLSIAQAVGLAQCLRAAAESARQSAAAAGG
ncbi:hypothetical protein [Rugosimonospora africana]|uniref:Uncharacterized protein n=1 Tax=Rugosimonospora africana TaxID=556532 RepID=A0A8J3QQQ4_9ACTN|nr:hypothetical protein [Rugosimonospora africana]GIH14032.1 hypothetical protein Raf01_22040 [Rugosimonospora africana]